MKKVLLLFMVVMAAGSTLHAQILKSVADKAKQKVLQRADQKVDNKMEEGLDKIEGKNKVKSAADDDGDNAEASFAKKTDGGAKGIKAYSRYDFVPGEKIVYADDFAQDVIGEFPLKWNTNGTGEIKKIDGQEGKWLNLVEGTFYEAAYQKPFPENYTIEFDLTLEFLESRSVPSITFLGFKKEGQVPYPGFYLEIHPQNGTYTSQGDQTTIDRFGFYSKTAGGSTYMSGKDQLNGELFNNQSRPVHVAIWVQKERLRAWVNSVKVYDLPKAVPAGFRPTNVGFEVGSYGGEASSYNYFVSNLKIAEALPDTRSKLITEGRMSTTGILFDANSDRIKPTSAGTLKEIAAILAENPGVKVKIIGHTDSDGDAAKNLDLSKRRAASVKAALSKDYGIDADRMETDGQGATKPVADNKTQEGKAQNRRVEFVKM